MSPGECQLAALAAALISDKATLTPAERKLIPSKRAPGARVLANVRKKIRAGLDPLGDQFCIIRTAIQRRDLGAVYTPPPIVEAMIAWASVEHATPRRVVDPGAGSGRYLMAAARQFPHAELIAIDVDPLALLTLRANAAVLGFSGRLRVHCSDYRLLTLPAIDGPTLFIGNPPYVRHHDIAERWKAWFAATAAQFKFSASKLAGLHIHFFLKTRQLAHPGDYGAFITAAEWLDVNYGSLLREMLADGLGGSAVHIIDPKAQPFSNALTTGAITCFHVGKRASAITMRAVNSLAELAPLAQGRAVAWDRIATAPKWSIFIREQAERPAGFIELGELFRVRRGQVTGSNAVWIESEAAQEIPARYLRPAITRARELIAAGTDLTSAAHLKRVVDLPRDLSGLSDDERRAVMRFLEWAKSRKAHEGYVAKHRAAWWAVDCYEPAPVLCTYMARRAPAFVRNHVGATHLNIAHGLYPKVDFADRDLEAVLAYLRSHIGTEGGRVYAGGLVKYEPKELERTLLPRVKDIDGFLTETETVAQTVVRRGARQRRQNSEGCISQ